MNHSVDLSIEGYLDINFFRYVYHNHLKIIDFCYGANLCYWDYKNVTRLIWLIQK
ncbi:hypothetical protein VCR6J2_40039 [Vibrio coralliirubri]|nr:hypothetical protein VCR6J2_40039 [Vibrio coralliirubri]